MHNYVEKVSQLAAEAERRHAAFYSQDTFNGPSLYYHEQALLAAGKTHEEFAAASYAMLVAWGMHRMGDGGPKMRYYTEYRDSLAPQWETIRGLQATTPDQLKEPHWEALRRIFFGIQAMRSDVLLVANSKILAHALPLLIAPIDRNYTLRFFHGNTYIRDGEWQWQTFRRLHEEGLYPVVRNAQFKQLATDWLSRRTDFQWDTSMLKIADNCLIAKPTVSLE